MAEKIKSDTKQQPQSSSWESLFLNNDGTRKSDYLESQKGQEELSIEETFDDWVQQLDDMVAEGKISSEEAKAQQEMMLESAVEGITTVRSEEYNRRHQEKMQELANALRRVTSKKDGVANNVAPEVLEDNSTDDEELSEPKLETEPIVELKPEPKPELNLDLEPESKLKPEPELGSELDSEPLPDTLEEIEAEEAKIDEEIAELKKELTLDEIESEIADIDEEITEPKEELTLDEINSEIADIDKEIAELKEELTLDEIDSEISDIDKEIAELKEELGLDDAETATAETVIAETSPSTRFDDLFKTENLEIRTGGIIEQARNFDSTFASFIAEPDAQSAFTYGSPKIAEYSFWWDSRSADEKARAAKILKELRKSDEWKYSNWDSSFMTWMQLKHPDALAR